MGYSFKIDLPSGRELYLRELWQYRTYKELIEGLPTAEFNAEKLVQLLEDKRHRLYGGPPYLIQPIETSLGYCCDRPYQFGTPSALPQITCIARFESFDPARDKEAHASGLTIIWFQGDFALPIETDVFDKITSIDWKSHAGDFCW